MPASGTSPVPVKVNFNVCIDAKGEIEISDVPFVKPQNIIVAERDLPVSALYDEGGQTGLLEVWEPSDAQGDIKTQLANTDSSGNGQGGPDLSGAYQVACKAFAQGLQAVLCDKFDCSGVTPFSITRYADIEQYYKQRDFGRVVLAYYAHHLFGHVDATAAITNDIAFVHNMLSINAAGGDETADGPDNRAAAWTKSITDPVESWDASGNESDANLALRLVEAVVAKGKDASGNFVISSVSTATTDSLANIVKQVIGQDSSRMNSVDGSERTRNQHQLLRFYPNDIIYMNINVQAPIVTVANHDPNPDNIANPPAATNVSAKSFTLKIRLTDGEPFLYSDNTNTTIIGYKGTVPTTLTIPTTVTAIADDAFLNATMLITANLPLGLTSIGARAFKGCTALTTIDIPSTVITIGASAFEGCTSLTTANLPGTGTKNLQTLQKTLIGTITSSSTIPLRLMRNGDIIEPTRATPYVPKPRVNTRIPKPRVVNPLNPKGKGKGKGMTKLRTVPKAAKSVFAILPASIFKGCTSLTTVFIPATVTTIKASAFENTTALTTVTLPTAVTTIESAAFKAAGLTEITLPPNLTTVPSNAFQNCVELVAIEIPENVVSIGALAFYGCVKLEEVIVNEGVETIATQAFQDCAALTFVELPNSLQTIAERAFQGAFTQAATPITVIVPLTVTYVPATANFPSFPSAVTVNYIEPTTNVVYSNSAATEVVSFGRPEPPAPPPDPTAPPPPPPTPTSTALTIPAGTTTIKAGAFRDTSTIAFTSVSIPSSVTTIEAGAFTSTSLTTVLVPIDATVASGAFESAVVLNYVDFATNLVYPPAAKTNKNTINGYNGTIPAIVALPSSVLTVKAGTFTGSALTTLRHNIFTTVESGAIETSVARQYIHYATNFVYEDTGFTTLAGYYGTVPSSLSIAASVTTIRANAFASNAQLTSVTIPSSVASIEAGAFSATGLTLARVPINCTLASGAFNNTTTIQYVDFDTDFVYSDTAKTALAAYNAAIPSALTIPSSVTTIEAAVFSGATTLNSVSIPASVTSMGAAVFSGCTFLGSATVGAQLTIMPASTFMNCPFLSNVTLPTTLVTIGSQAFRNTGFGSVDLPNVLDIQAQAFFNNTAISSITARQVSTIATDAFTGCTSLQEYPAEGSRLIISGTTVTGYSGTLDGTLTIPDGIDVIDALAFNIKYTLRGINLPDTLKVISTQAFNRTALRSITFPDSISTIGSIAFQFISTMSSLTLPNYPISYGIGVFQYAQGLTSVTMPAQFRNINSNISMFNGCSNLTTLILENGVSSIAATTFTNCSSLRSFDMPASLAQIGSNAFTFTNMSSVTVPQTLSSIGAYAFSNCRNLTSLTLPYNQIAIGDNSFASTSLQSVTIPGGWSNVPNIFVYCRMLESVDIQGPITSIASYAFYFNRLSSFTIPPTLISLGGNVFAGNVSLSSITIPASVTNYGGNAFQNCTSLSSATILRTGITSMAGLFDGCSALSQFNMNMTSLRDLGSAAFRNTRISTFNLPSISTIQQQAFANNPNLSTVFAPNVNRVAADAFTGCTALQDYPASASTFTIAAGGILTAVSGGSVAGRLRIPTGVSTINASLFLNQTSMIGVSFPTTLRNISTAAFSNTGIRELTLPASVSSLGARAFNRCLALSSIAWPATPISTIQSDVFNACTALQTAVIPSWMTSVPSGTFFYASGVRSIVFQGNTTTLNTYSFASTRISSFNAPTSLTTISDRAFFNCYNLSTVTLGNITTMTGRTFESCTALQSIVIPATYSVSLTNSHNFSSCTALGSATYANNTQLIQTGMFDGCTSLSTLTFANINALSNIGAWALRNTRIASFNGPNVSSINAGAFANNPYLSSVIVPKATRVAADAFTGCTALRDYPATASTFTITNGAVTAVSGGSLVGRLNILASARAVNASLFMSNSQLFGVNFGTSISSISTSAFAYSGLRDLTITSNIQQIAPFAFRGISTLSSLTFQHSVSSLNATAFMECSSIAQFVASNGFSNAPANFFQTFQQLSSVVLGGTQVIDSGEFSNCANLNSVTLLDTTTVISTFAFSGTNLRTIEIPPSVTRIDANAFINTPLSSIIYYGATPTLGANALPVGAVEVNRAFDPKSVVGLKAWFDAQDSATIVRSLSTVSQWSDKSFNGFHMTPVNTSTVRYHVESPVGGYPALNFSNFAQLQTPSLSLSETNSTSVFIVMNQTGLAPAGAGPNADFFIADDYRRVTLTTNVPASTIQVYRGANTAIANVNITNTNCITGLVANGTTTASLYLNTSTAATFVPNTYYSLAITSPYRIGGGKWQGNMCEVLMYSNAVSQGARQAIEGYLAWKWGIQGNLPAEHPFKAAAPINATPISLMNINFNNGNTDSLINYNGANLSSSTPSGTGYSYSIPSPNLLYKPITIAATNTVTFAASVYKTGTTDFPGIIFTRTNGATGMNLHGGADTLAYHWADINEGDNWDTGYIVPLNTWVHIALVIAPTTATLYVNGVLTATRTGAFHSPVAMTDLYLGVDPVFGGNSRTWTGSVDNLAVYNMILTAEEVSALYTATLTG